MLPIVGKGSVQNISDILFLRGVDIGIVQSDALAYVRRQRQVPGVGQSIQYIAKLYEEEVHVLARRDIVRMEDLAGQAVNVDVRGSGTAMTAQLLLEGLGIRARLVQDDQDNALARLKAGEIAAIVYVVGKPARLFSALGPDHGLHFLPIPLTAALAETYLPTRLGHGDYPDVISTDEEVETVAVSAVMAVFAWPPSGERHRRVAQFTESFYRLFPLFLQPGRHPKWKDVNLAAQVPGWTRFPAAQDELRRRTVAATTNGALQVQFDAFLKDRGNALPNLTPAETQALFQQFLDWWQKGRTGGR